MFVAQAVGNRAQVGQRVGDQHVLWQRLGLGRILLQHLMTAARAHGFKRMYTVDAATNLPLRELTHALGFNSVTDPDERTQIISSVAL
ncbi:N-acetyltransferase family protein [Pseudomonas sp. O39]|uniref:GNAT family N-acetyltransferase n=1 Tax=Pseudomonas sp. O39 TaxID=3379130 RepID=UPI00387AE6DF